jgi:hypothetical protein
MGRECIGNRIGLIIKGSCVGVNSFIQRSCIHY